MTRTARSWEPSPPELSSVRGARACSPLSQMAAIAWAHHQSRRHPSPHPSPQQRAQMDAPKSRTSVVDPGGAVRLGARPETPVISLQAIASHRVVARLLKHRLLLAGRPAGPRLRRLLLVAGHDGSGRRRNSRRRSRCLSPKPTARGTTRMPAVQLSRAQSAPRPSIQSARWMCTSSPPMWAMGPLLRTKWLTVNREAVPRAYCTLQPQSARQTLRRRQAALDRNPRRAQRMSRRECQPRGAELPLVAQVAVAGRFKLLGRLTQTSSNGVPAAASRRGRSAIDKRNCSSVRVARPWRFRSKRPCTTKQHGHLSEGGHRPPPKFRLPLSPMRPHILISRWRRHRNFLRCQRLRRPPPLPTTPVWTDGPPPTSAHTSQ
mmetsp:Transcript_3943/g.11150  ORF Transcript_3943/g.11150 Transcript_3943/m.11150 type:complete len:376 (+) Transcript_3943:221-1348(+)